jgi:enediyne biosynthesis protein E4
MFSKTRWLFLLTIIILGSISISLADDVDIILEMQSLSITDNCSNSFITHNLDHITIPVERPIGYYDSNGAGLAINDLNNDGLLDLVFANLAGDNAIFWNQGNLEFEKEPLPSISPSRSVSIVDVDGDSWMDIVFTQQVSAPLYWHNQKGKGFETQILRGVTYIGYAMNWGDLDGDGDLDLVTGSYDAEIKKLFGQSSKVMGVVYYENNRGSFVATRLADTSDTLALLINDINDDGQNDIVVGNDFALKDQYFSYLNGSWIELASLSVMPHSTMSFDAADINNNGNVEMMAVDMKPYSDDDEMMAQWQHVLAMMETMPHDAGDPQIMENVMYGRDANGNLENLARNIAIDSTGWSWSSKFGDLDNDGFEDLYVVNGMISTELFSNLPNDELVEENQVYHNLQGVQFEARPDWELNSTSSGRGMSMGDLDNDGDLDIVVNNLQSNATVFENQLCGGSNIAIDLIWTGSENTRAIGSTVVLHTSTGTYQRTIKASSGYLSGDTSRIHIGFPLDTEIYELTIKWPDNETSQIDNLSINTLISVTRN